MRRLLAVLGLMALIAVPGVARAGRVAVVVDGGRTGRVVQAELVGALIGAGVDVISAREYQGDARRAGVRDEDATTPDGIRRTGAVAAVDGVLVGHAHGRGRHTSVRIEYYDSMGERQLARSYRLRRGRLSQRDLGRIASFVRRKLPAPSSTSDASDTAPPPDTTSTDTQPPPVDDGRVADRRADDVQASDRQADDRQASDRHADDRHADDRQADDRQADDRQASDPQASDRSFDDRRADDRTTQRDTTSQPDDLDNPPPTDTRRERRHRDDSRRRDDTRRSDHRVADEAWRRTGRRENGGFGDDWASEHRRRPVEDIEPDRPRLPLFAIRALGGGGSRSYHLDGQPTQVDYQTSGLYPEGGGLLDIFPFRGLGPFVEGLGIEGLFTRGFLTSQFVDASGQASSLSTPVQRWFVDLRYRVRAVPTSPWSPAFGVRAGYGASDFTADLANAVFTGVHNDGLRIGLEVAQPLLPPFLFIQATLTAMPVSTPGQAEATAYGPDATASGYEIRGGLFGGSAALDRGFVWGVWIDVLSHSDTFKGVGSRDSGGAKSSETYMSITGGLGYAY